jgi:HNH endonuclease/AP2 domain
VEKFKLTQERVRELLHYDEDSGQFHWRVTKRPNIRAGDVAGCQVRSEYWTIHIDGHSYSAHQLAWLYMKGIWGRPLIDHRDGNRLNNRWSNLRRASYADNAANRRRLPKNTSGFKGVSFDRPKGKWKAQIRKDGKNYFIGRYATAEQAHAAYVAKARELFGEFARTD